MKKLMTVLMSAIALISTTTQAQSTDISGMDYAIYLENPTVNDKDEVTVSVMMNNTEEVTAFQFALILPDEISILKNKNKYRIQLSEERLINSEEVEDDHGLQISLKANGTIQVICYSYESIPFAGNNGEVATITFKAPIGKYKIELCDQIITKLNSQNIEPKNVISEITVLKDITLNDKGWATFSSNTNLQVETSGVKVCTGTCDGTKVSTAATGNSIIPANEGVLLRGEAGQKVSFSVAESGSSLAQNELLPTSTTSGLESIPTTGKVYVLNGDEFLVYAAEEFVPNKAYLHLSGAGAELRISSEDESTSIENITTDNNAKEAYSLQGQRLIQSQKGMSIINGEKVFVK